MAAGENGSAAVDPLAGERLRPCARVPPSSGFAAVLELARAPGVPAVSAAPICAARHQVAA